MKGARQLLLAIGLMALALVITAPAALLTRFVPKYIETGAWAGTLWNGQVQDIRFHGRPFLDSFAWNWQLSRLLLLSASFDLKTQWHGEPGRARVDASLSAVEIRHAHLLFPIEPLSAVNPKVAEYRPAGDLQLQSESFRIEEGRGQGVIEGEWQAAKTGWTGNTILGRYRLYLRAVSQGYAFRIETLEGPLELTGDSTGDPKQGWNLGIAAKLPASGIQGLEPLLSRLEAAPDGRYILRYSFR